MESVSLPRAIHPIRFVSGQKEVRDEAAELREFSPDDFCERLATHGTEGVSGIECHDDCFVPST
eukprot:8290526-Prorocentrum_lima.AAC.1